MNSTKNPYEADADKISQDDRFYDVPLYGRYLPWEGEFKPEKRHINSKRPESLEYWENVLRMCVEKRRVCPGSNGARDVFALGSVIIKSSHLKPPIEAIACRDYSFSDANEVNALRLAREVLKDIQVPEIFFAGKIHGRDVLVQSRIPGVGLNVAWDYLSAEQKRSFKMQARSLLTQMHATPSPIAKPTYVFPDPDPIKHRRIQEVESQFLFEETDPSSLGFMHNDLTQSNIIVNNNKIVGIIDWEMAGFFEWNAVAKVHIAIRSPTRESFNHLELEDDFLRDILYWNDLYL